MTVRHLSELDDVRAALGARVDSCWDRLEDVVSELVALHSVPSESIIARVREAALVEDEAAVAPTRSRQGHARLR